jgi:hypothetical protein
MRLSSQPSSVGQDPVITAAIPPLARQKYWEIRTDFTTLLLHNYQLKLDCEDYRKILLGPRTCLAFL